MIDSPKQIIRNTAGVAMEEGSTAAAAVMLVNERRLARGADGVDLYVFLYALHHGKGRGCDEQQGGGMGGCVVSRGHPGGLTVGKRRPGGASPQMMP